MLVAVTSQVDRALDPLTSLGELATQPPVPTKGHAQFERNRNTVGRWWIGGVYAGCPSQGLVQVVMLGRNPIPCLDKAGAAEQWSHVLGDRQVLHCMLLTDDVELTA